MNFIMLIVVMLNVINMWVILHERSERSERSEVKGIKNRHKKISPAPIWMGVRVSVCLSVCLSRLKS